VSRGRVAIALLALAAALLAPAPAPLSATPAGLPAPQTLTLRLSDVGPGYTDTAPCEPQPLADFNSPRPLKRLASSVAHKGCWIRFDQAWRHIDRARPRGITNVAFVFASAAGAQGALRQARDVIALAIGAEPDEITEVASERVGDEARAFRIDSYEGPGFAVLWRSGPTLALVSATGSSDTLTEQAVYRLTSAQQARIASPSALRPADLDDIEVPLDDPSLHLPVQWLGRALPARGGRVPLTLYVAIGPGPNRSGTGPGAMLEYGHEGWLQFDHRRMRTAIADVDLEMWAPSAERRIVHEELDRSCVRRYDGRLHGIRATIFGSYRSPGRRCGEKPPELWRALARFRGVVVTIDPNVCTSCHRRRATYASLAGLRTLLHALRPRERRAAS